jgi:hypothetical protein
LRNRSWTAHVTQEQHFYLEISAFICNSQHVSDAHIFGWFGWLPAG